MLKNYLTIAWRNLLKHKIASFINIGGLSIGMAVTTLIGLWIWDELNFDHYHTNYDRVAQIQQYESKNGNTETWPAVPFPLGNELKTLYGNNFKYIAMASWQGDHMLSTNNNYLNKNGIYIDKDGPYILSLDMLKGSRKSLSNPNSILISESTAKAFLEMRTPSINR
ncbi:ABC transporter permease [Niabella hibiscisoli]|uniref:ABC transporter permease n=1 Tax=Niabella hibiscisoli TaxID=1825928 RepID=UPI001F0D4D66|nr:ABC transporter permease [Niabella hibiscisoli]MCH5718653.1 ABC transporter permease [Niabella hibiscisoli]